MTKEKFLLTLFTINKYLKFESSSVGARRSAEIDRSFSAIAIGALADTHGYVRGNNGLMRVRCGMVQNAGR